MSALAGASAACSCLPFAPYDRYVQSLYPSINCRKILCQVVESRAGIEFRSDQRAFTNPGLHDQRRLMAALGRTWPSW
jgi:hypothetical protein